ncbi:CPBP family intramembrane glutamic endopeptidase [Thermoactinospora rubra]|uniref:CPBP family intramembrane glutamic endopeptidase n=1 Tax=Thermoactinospora rubra TaxID=1088767 RepID=UPI000A119A5B|nr:type II CAAX endopeptidase family protein [Thermoactinospora rubra]
MKRSHLTVFLAVAFGGAWLAALPLWLGDGLASSTLFLAALAMMITPTLGVLAAWALDRRPFRVLARETGLTLGGRPARTLWIAGAAWLGTPLLVMLGLGVSMALGMLPADLTALRQTLERQGVPIPGDLQLIVVLQLVGAALTGPVLNAVPAFGEEWGWRGWLLPRLVEARGVPFAIVVSGVIWGAWHAPLTLLGYNYPTLGPLAAPFFLGFTVLAGALLAWLRLRSGSVWPCVIAHGSLNAVGPVVGLFGNPSAPPNYALVAPMGLIGWALMAVLAVALFRLRPVRRADAVSPAPRG